MKNAVFRDVTTWASCKNRRLRGKYRLHHQGDKNRRVFLRIVHRLLVTANLDDGGDMFFRNVGSYTSHTASLGRKIFFIQDVVQTGSGVKPGSYTMGSEAIKLIPTQGVGNVDLHLPSPHTSSRRSA
jgi:hypothetical protein